MLIGLNGRLKSGKDTTFEIIKALHPQAERVSFADKLKASAAAALGITVAEMEALKAREDVTYKLGLPLNKIHRGLDPDMLKIQGFNVRQYLQRYGTEAHRDIFGDNFWIDMALPLGLDHSLKLLVVTDMRFPNEAQRVRDLGGVTAKVVRVVDTEHSNHPSEQNIDSMIDYYIDNTGTLDELPGVVSAFMDTLTFNLKSDTLKEVVRSA